MLLLQVLQQLGDGFGLRGALGPDPDPLAADLLDVDERAQVIDYDNHVSGIGAKWIHCRTQHERRPIVQRLDLAVHRVDERVGGALLRHGVDLHA